MSTINRLIWVADSRRILSEFPDPVQRHVGFAAYQAQIGNKHPDAKPLKTRRRRNARSCLRSSRRHLPHRLHGQTGKAVYVLHAFQKKSKQGIATPKSEIELVKQRLQRAIEIDRELEN